MKEVIKFYADTPNSIKNKYFWYEVEDINHSLDLLQRFIKNGFKIRIAYHHINGKQIKIKKELFEIVTQTNTEPQVNKALSKYSTPDLGSYF